MKKYICFIIFLWATPCFAALSANTTFEFRSTATANMVNGGGFNSTNASPGTNRSLTDTAYKDHTDLVIGSAGSENKVTSAAHAFTSDDNGNIIHITAGTGFTVGWYEVVSVDGSNVATLDRVCGTADSTGGTYYLGGALNVGGSLEDDFFEEISGANAADGITVYFYNNNSTTSVVFTPSENISIAGAGGASAPIKVLGYKTTRGDNPTGNSRPTIAVGTNAQVWGNNFDLYNLQFTGTTAGNMVTLGGASKFINCKAVNAAASASRAALNMASGDNFIFNSEFVSYWGRAIASSVSGTFIGNYIHDSNVGIASTSTSAQIIAKNLIESCVAQAINLNAANAAQYIIDGNTLYGSENTTGVGINIATGTTDLRIINNIIYGFVSGVVHADTQTIGYDDYNDYFGNDTPVTNWTQGANNSALNPTFTSVSQITGTAGAFVAGGSKLVDTSKNFTTLGVTTGRDCVYIVSGTGVTAGTYLIDSISTTTNPNDTLNITVPASPGTDTTADKVYQITIGRNFAIGTNLKALGFPGAFQGGITTGYLDMGGVQRQESGTSAVTHSFGFVN